MPHVQSNPHTGDIIPAYIFAHSLLAAHILAVWPAHFLPNSFFYLRANRIRHSLLTTSSHIYGIDLLFHADSTFTRILAHSTVASGNSVRKFCYLRLHLGLYLIMYEFEFLLDLERILCILKSWHLIDEFQNQILETCIE